MSRLKLHLAVVAIGLLAPLASASDPAAISELIRKLNEHETVKGSDESKSYKLLFDAYLELSDPPMPVGEDFNLATIHGGMPQWSQVAGWAESNPGMADAIMAASEKIIIGLPYGRDNVDSLYREAGLMVQIGIGDNLRHYEFPYLDAVDVIAAFAIAETYRRFEAKQTAAALDLALANAIVLRQFCDRDFVFEKSRCMNLLSIALTVLRDQFYVYFDDIGSDRFTQIAKREIPYLRPDRNRLLLPEADKLISEALIREVFDDATGNPRPAAFAETFAKVQSADEPFTRFGAARRWQMVAEVHGSLDASLENLNLIYDDWWRRWRVQEFDVIVTFATHQDRINEVRYAAVIYSVQNLDDLVPARNRLIAEVNGTAVAAGICAYQRALKETPDNLVKVRPQYVRKMSDTDPFHPDYDNFRYRVVEKPARAATDGEAIDTIAGDRIWVKDGNCILYSVGQDMTDDRGRTHADDGFEGDIVIWPPVRALLREEGLLE